MGVCGGEGKIGKKLVRCCRLPHQTRFYFWGLLHMCRFGWKSITKCDRESAHRRTDTFTDWQMHTGFIICPMLCYWIYPPPKSSIEWIFHGKNWLCWDIYGPAVLFTRSVLWSLKYAKNMANMPKMLRLTPLRELTTLPDPLVCWGRGHLLPDSHPSRRSAPRFSRLRPSASVLRSR